jgi:hypothetical protein
MLDVAFFLACLLACLMLIVEMRSLLKTVVKSDNMGWCKRNWGNRVDVQETILSTINFLSLGCIAPSN